MKLMKRILLAGMFLLPAAGTVLQAQNEADTRVITGEKGKMTLISAAAGANDASLSRNEKYVYGTFGEDEGGYIYELATGKFQIYEGFGMVEVLDFDNYVTSTHIVRNGQRIDLKTEGLREGHLMLASSDLSVLSYFTYTGSMYASVLFDGEGNILDTLPHYDPTMGGGYGSTAWAMSDDAGILAGRSSVPGGWSNFAPVFWDRDADTMFFVGVPGVQEKMAGTLMDVDKEGTVIVGERASTAVWIEYDKTAKTWQLHEIAPSPGFEINYAFAVSDAPRMVVGVDQASATDVYSRKPWLYLNDKDSKVDLAEYLLHLYGLEAESAIPLFTPGSLSADARTIVGYSYDGPNWMPYVIELEAEQIYPVARNLTARQIRGEANVLVKWTAPMEGDYTLLSYNLYRDSVKIATVNAGDPLTYTDNAVAAGKHSYQMEAVYEDGKVSAWTPAYNVIVVAVDGCLPVQEITAEVVYNRTVKLSWGLPTSVAAEQAPGVKRERDATSRVIYAGGSAKNEAKYLADSELDFVDVFDTKGQTSSAAVRIGDYLYVSDFWGNNIRIFNRLTGEMLTDVVVEGLRGVYDMIYHDGILYCVCNDNNVYEVAVSSSDPFDLSLANQWATLGQELSHIGYIEGGNNGEDMLVLGHWTNLFFYPLNPGQPEDTIGGIAERFDVSDVIISGSAYHNGRLYLANQTDKGGRCIIEIYDWESGKHLSSSDIAVYPRVQEALFNAEASMAGLSVATLEDGTTVLEGMIQPAYNLNQVVTVEIESSPDVKGYNIYRNGTKINTDPIEARHFEEKLMEPGSYTYDIEFVSESGCTIKSSDFGVTETVEIYAIGSCAPPTDLTVIESNEQACLSWVEPQGENTDGFVGFNIYRDDELLSEHLIDLKFFDADIEKGQTYLYKVEAFYENSCVASDSMELTPTFEGTAEAPSVVKVNGTKAENGLWNTTTTWDLPYFETPMTMGYCSVPAGAVTLSGTSTVYAAIGWGAEQMDLFEDLYLVGVEFVIGAEVNSLNGIVYVDNQMVHNEVMTDRLRIGEWNRMLFSKTFPMKQEEEIVVGFAISFDPDASTDGNLVYDLGPAIQGFGDLVSPDGNNWYSLKASNIDANLCINALVVRKRDLEAAAKMPNADEYLMTKVMNAGPLDFTPARVMTNVPKTTSEAYTLTGFNVYRDEEKLNEEPLTVFSFEDLGLPDGAYEYSVGAVYKDEEEVISDPVYVELTDVANQESEALRTVSVYPNPVLDELRIDGEYATLSLIDMTGRVVLSDVRNEKIISMASYKSGVYFVKVTFQNGESYITKIVKR